MSGAGWADNLRDTPAYVIDENKLRQNLAILAKVQRETGAKILLAQKCFALFRLYPLIGEYLAGTAASGLFEARLARDEMGKENHVFAPAYKESEFVEIANLCDHVVFNSFRQLKKFAAIAKEHGAQCGLRINPEHSTQAAAIYDPCAEGSRMGIKRADFPADGLPSEVDGLHFHTLCEQNADALAETLAAVEEKFGEYLPKIKWLNFGGGHHITRADYRLDILRECIRRMQQKYNLTVYLEPGEAVALDAGYLATRVLEVRADGNVIIDASAACHAPDVLEMPYRPRIMGADVPGAKAYTYRLGAATCLAGDVFGEYSFADPLKEGDCLLFEDMAIYTMVKNNTFNGVPLPTIMLLRSDGTLTTVKKFGYDDFKERLS